MRLKSIGVKIVTLAIIAIMVLSGCAGASNNTTSGSENNDTSSDTASGSENDNTSSDTSSDESSGGDEKELVFAYIMSDAANEYSVQQKEGVEAKAKELGVTVDIQSPTTSEGSEEQVGFIETAIARKVDGIFIFPNSVEGLYTAVQKAQESGIPFLSLTHRFDPDKMEELGLEYVPYVGVNNVLGGNLVGEFMKENFPKGTKTVIITGSEGANTNTERLQGLFEIVGEQGPDCWIDVVAMQTANWDVEQGYKVMQNMLSANPDIELVFAICDTMGIGALRAIEEANKKEQISIISYDGIREALSLVEQGDFLATVGMKPRDEGQIGLQYLYDWVTKGEKPQQDTDTGVTVVTQENLDEYRAALSE